MAEPEQTEDAAKLERLQREADQEKGEWSENTPADERDPARPTAD